MTYTLLLLVAFWVGGYGDNYYRINHGPNPPRHLPVNFQH